MRKSSKKVKSERINAIRKQYDAFLEEDRQRRDRNSFILEKLDKMRLSSTNIQLPIKYKTDLHRQQEVDISHDKQIENYTSYSPHKTQHMSRDTEIFQDSSILQKIAESFILIPKRNITSFSNYAANSKSITNNGSDWKHKYEILNELKKNEIDSPIEKYSKDNHNVERKRGIKNNNKDETNSINFDMQNENKVEKHIIKTNIEDSTKACYNLSTKELNATAEKIPISMKYDKNETKKEILIKPKTESLENIQCPNMDKRHRGAINNGIHDDNSKNSIPYGNKVNHNMDNMEYIKSNCEYITPVECNMTKSEDGQNITYVEEDDVNTVKEVEPYDLVKEINSDMPPANVMSLYDTIQYSTEITNIQEGGPEDNVKFQDNTITEKHTTNETIDLSYQNNVGNVINHEIDNSTYYDQPPIENLESNDVINVNSDIEAFDTEQREMFYSEQVDENYAYDQSNVTNDSFNQEYTDNTRYEENSEYYDGVHVEQGFPPEINEHEETSELYDQNYENQYSTYEQGYEETQQYEQTDEHEETQVNDFVQSEIDQLQHEQNNNETLEHVEGQLVYEEGLMEKPITKESNEAQAERDLVQEKKENK